MSKFKSLVRGLDAETLDELGRRVAEEMEQRRQKTAIHIENIHPLMPEEDRARAMAEIARVLAERR
jgi:hypothetical protein